MARSFLVPIDLNKLELLNLRLQQLASDPSSPVTGQTYYNTASATIRFYNGSAWLDLGRLDQLAAPTTVVSMNSQRITNVADPSGAQDAATKNYVDGIAGGISWKDSVRVATAAAGTLASSFANGQTVDGTVLATGNRILIKNQAAPAENGLYTVNASGVPTRATDADTGAEIVAAAVFVEEGATLADTLWVNQTNAPITLGTTALTFAQIGAGTSYSAGAGIAIAGNVISIENSGVLLPTHGGTGQATLTANGVLLGNGTGSVAATAVGATGTVLKGVTGAAPAYGAVNLAADVTGTLPIGNGGTGQTTAAGTKTALGYLTRYAQSYGDGAALAYTITHNLATLDVIVQVFRNSDGVEVEVDVTRTAINTVSIAHAVAPTANQYRVVVTG
jgi:hypothetical protein